MGGASLYLDVSRLSGNCWKVPRVYFLLTTTDRLKMREEVEPSPLTNPTSLSLRQPLLRSKVSFNHYWVTWLCSIITESEEERGVPPPSHAPPPLPPPPRPALPVSSKEQQRTKVIDELIFTERDFHHQMDLCSSKVLPALREVSHCNYISHLHV